MEFFGNPIWKRGVKKQLAGLALVLRVFEKDGLRSLLGEISEVMEEPLDGAVSADTPPTRGTTAMLLNNSVQADFRLRDILRSFPFRTRVGCIFRTTHNDLLEGIPHG